MRLQAGPGAEARPHPDHDDQFHVDFINLASVHLKRPPPTAVPAPGGIGAEQPTR